jgi:hypothetical protein
MLYQRRLNNVNFILTRITAIVILKQHLRTLLGTGDFMDFEFNVSKRLRILLFVQLKQYKTDRSEECSFLVTF